MSQKNVSQLVASSSWETETLSATAWEDFQDDWQKNSSAQQERLEEIRCKAEALFQAARGQHFEDGLESEFSNELIALIEKHDEVAINAIARLVGSAIVHDEVVSEALRWLGRMNHPSTYHSRLLLLEGSLFSPSARVRDGAALGLAAMDDSHAIFYLEQAIQMEKQAELREDLKQVLTQLEASKQCRIF